MEKPRNVLSYVTTPADDDDAHLAVGDTLTAKQDLFARVLAETGNQAAAYRKVYNVRPRTLPNTIWVNSGRIAALPQVRARVRHYQDIATLDAIMSIRELFQHCVDIATADPNEISRVVHRCCRYCHGHNFKYQWKDDEEFLDASIKYAEDKRPTGNAPSDEGGYGYTGHIEPNPICPHCYGVGEVHVVIADTTQLTGKARKLYAGAKQDRFGCVEVKLHDQDKAREMVARMLGAFDDKLDLRTPEERARAEAKTKLPDNVTEDQAAHAYLELLGTA
jgi:phage terminase small subunit